MKIKLKLIGFSLFICTFCVNAQQKSRTDTTKRVDKEASFAGGNSAWIKFLEKNQNTNLSEHLTISKEKNFTSSTVIAQFDIDTSGIISNIQILNKDKIREELSTEAIRILMLSPAWIPAEKKGKKISCRYIQKITWCRSEE